MYDEITALSRILAVLREPVARKSYAFPSLDLIKGQQDSCESEDRSEVVIEKLATFGFKATVEGRKVGPVVTRYELQLAPGVKISSIRAIAEDLAVALMSDRVRILAPIPGTSLVGVEIVNESRATVEFKTSLREAIRVGRGEGRSMELPMALGCDTAGTPKVLDLAKMPHLLVAGQTGSGKSVGLGTIIMSLLYTRTPDECRLVLVDPKRVELSLFAKVPHVDRVITESEDAAEMFAGLVNEMESRYRLLEQAGVRNIAAYNRDGLKMPYIVVVVDEMADLIMSAKETEVSIVRLAQKARAVGIHLVLATQKPVVKVITGLIKSNIPSRLAFQVASKSDSRVILDTNGAEKLSGRGDMLALYVGVSDPERLHGAWVSDLEIASVVNSIGG